MRETTDPRMELLLDNLDRAFARRSWHGTTLRGSLRGLKPETALWKPAPDRNSIWQLVLHAAYWKYIVRRHLTADTEARFPRSPRNFPAPPEDPTAAALKRDIRLLVDEHALLRASVADTPPSRLDTRRTASGPTPRVLILGVAAHDLYHAGQIQLLKRLHSSAGELRR